MKTRFNIDINSNSTYFDKTFSFTLSLNPVVISSSADNCLKNSHSNRSRVREVFCHCSSTLIFTFSAIAELISRKKHKQNII